MKRYETSLNKKLKNFVEWQIEHYHDSKRLLKESKIDMLPSLTSAYSSTVPGKAGECRKTENITFKLLSDQYIFQTSRTVDAIERVLKKLSPEDLALVDLVYWRGSHSITGAALALHMSKSAAYRKNNAIIMAVAKELGYATF